MSFFMKTQFRYRLILYVLLFSLVLYFFTIALLYEIPQNMLFILFLFMGIFIIGLGYVLARLTHHSLEIDNEFVILNDKEAFYLHQINKVYYGSFSFIEQFEKQDALVIHRLRGYHTRQFFTKKHGKGTEMVKKQAYLVFKEGKHLHFVKAQEFPYHKIQEFFSIMRERNIPLEIDNSCL